jgi:hypothetical protein
MKKILLSGLTLGAIAMLTGCGGGGDDGASSSALGRGFYIDSPVDGVHYLCGNQEGTTDSKGMFKFQKSYSCTFTLGTVILRNVPSTQLSDGISIVENEIATATFLQTLDADGNASNGIQITPEIAKTIKEAIHTTAIPQGSADLSAIFNTLKTSATSYNGKIVTEQEAQQHVEQTQTSVTKKLLSGKTFYIVHVSDSSHFLGKYAINKEVTEGTWRGIVNDSASQTSAIAVQGNKLTLAYNNSYLLILGKYQNYILTSNYTANGTPDGENYLFSNEAVAQSFYYAKYPKTSGNTNNDTNNSNTQKAQKLTIQKTTDVKGYTIASNNASIADGKMHQQVTVSFACDGSFTSITKMDAYGNTLPDEKAKGNTITIDTGTMHDLAWSGTYTTKTDSHTIGERYNDSLPLDKNNQIVTGVTCWEAFGKGSGATCPNNLFVQTIKQDKICN